MIWSTIMVLLALFETGYSLFELAFFWLSAHQKQSNIWATFCAYSRSHLPQIANLYDIIKIQVWK